MSKKLLLSCLLSLFCMANIIAGNPVSVKSGKISALKTTSKAIMDVDYSEAKVGKIPLEEYLIGRGEDFVRDWPQETNTAASYFKERFNKKSKGMKLTTDETIASYKLLIKVKTLDMGNAGSFFVTMAIGGSSKAGGVIMCGTVEIIDLATKQVLGVLYVDEVKGGGAPQDAVRMGLMFSELATKICKLKDK